MFLKSCIIVILALSVVGCANPKVKQLRDWSGSAKELARSGQMRWSDYYKGLYDRVVDLPEMQGKAFYLHGANLLLDSALAMEEGKISQQQFDSFQRAMIAAESDYAERIRVQNSAVWAQAAANYNQFLQTQAIQVQAWQANRPFSCVSQRLGNSLTTNCR
jgi:hypothetical protein